MPGPKSPAHAALGEALREFRTRRSVSQEELGYQAGLHRNYVGACERGEINLSFSVLLRLSGALDVPLSELMRRYEERQAQTKPP